MFCPVCKAEYRQGFTRCADCDVELVWELPSEAIVYHVPVAPGDPDEDPFCSFWSGDDSRIHAELCELLDKESIPHKTVRREDHLFHVSRYPAFQMGIPFSMFEKAEAVVKEAYGSGDEPQDAVQLLPYQKGRVASSRTVGPWLPSPRGFAWSARDQKADGASQAQSGPEQPSVETEAEQSGLNWDPGNWQPEDASVEVWRGDSAELGEMLGSSRRENRIHFRLDAFGNKHSLFVLPKDEMRAREIAREVVEGVPPE
jgi:hypothetical protein